MDNRTLDKEIAEKFLSWQRRDLYWCDKAGTEIIEIEHFKPSSLSADNAAVVNEIERRGWGWKLVYFPGELYRMTIYTLVNRMFNADGDNRYQVICEAALQAVETERG